MKNYFLLARTLIRLIAVCLMLSLGLTACGTEATPISSAGTAVAGAVQTVGTAVAGGAQTAGTVVSGALETAGPTLTSGTQTVGTIVAGALTPGATPTVSSTLINPSTTSTAASDLAKLSQDLPQYPGTQTLELMPQEYSELIKGLPLINNLVPGSVFTMYKVGGVAEQATVADFYKVALRGDGWADWSDRLGFITNSGNIELFGARPSIYTRNDNILIMGVSSSLSQDFILNSGLGTAFQPGDIVILTLLGKSTTKIS